MKILKSSLILALFLWGNCALAGLGLNSRPTPYLGDNVLPSRPAPIEFGNPMLGSGKISPGTVNPRLWIFGLIRTALQAFRTGNSPDSSEWANRIDLFANLQFTSTERLFLHLRPLNKNARYTSYIFRPDECKGYQDDINLRITQLFFEGDFGEMFPKVQARTRKPLDIGFAIGRQQLFLQDGILINDFVDSIAITQNSIAFQGVNNLQIAGYFGLNNIDRDDNRADRDALLFGLHVAMDVPKHTVDVDLGYVNSNSHPDKGNLLAGAISTVQRIGHWRVSLHALGSVATTHPTRQSNDGALLFVESNRECGPHHDFVYVNGGVALGEFTSLARDTTVGGPLGRTGILFAAAGIGNLGSALNNRANRCVVAAAGYQKFFDFNWQGILELAGRLNTDTAVGDSIALGARLQRGIGKRCVLRFDAFGGARDQLHSVYGLRTELLIKV